MASVDLEAYSVYTEMVLEFLNSESNVSGSSQAMLVGEDYPGFCSSQDVPRQMTSIHLAAYFGLSDIVQTSIRNQHDPDTEDSYKRTPLSWAAANGHEGVVKTLLERGAAVDFRDTSFGRTPLSWAAANGHEAVVKILLDRGAAVNSADRGGQTPLSRAAENGHEGVVRTLLERGAAVDSIGTEYSETPLLWATKNGHEGVVKTLLEKGVAVDSRDKFDRTPLLCAAENGHEEIVKILLNRGAEAVGI
jgi:ankyrin repeat protein